MSGETLLLPLGSAGSQGFERKLPLLAGCSHGRVSTRLLRPDGPGPGGGRAAAAAPQQSQEVTKTRVCSLFAGKVSRLNTRRGGTPGRRHRRIICVLAEELGPQNLRAACKRQGRRSRGHLIAGKETLRTRNPHLPGRWVRKGRGDPAVCACVRERAWCVWRNHTRQWSSKLSLSSSPGASQGPCSFPASRYHAF